MTDETRETLAKLAEKFESDHPYGTALRDVLTPRTCGTCRHASFYIGSEYGMCGGDGIAIGRDITEDDGCIRGWQAREGEGGGK